MDFSGRTAKHETLLNLLADSATGESVLFPPSLSNLPIDQFWLSVCKILRYRDEDLVKRVALLAQLEPAGSLDDLPLAVNLLLPEETAVALKVVPLGKEDNTLLLAVADPFEQGLYESLRFALDGPFALRVASPLKIGVALSTLYFDAATDFSPVGQLDLDQNNDRGTGSIESQIPRLCGRLFDEALKRRASDLHIQKLSGSYVVRLRVDGVLERLTVLPSIVAKSISRFLKVQTSLDTTNTFTPQDGHMAISQGGRSFDLRLSFLPTNSGSEKIVVRFLNRQTDYGLTNLGLSLDEIHRMRRMAASPSGVILMTGPTGSGKTTTLYSMLGEVNSEEVSISTVEDPVEYRMPGIAQTQVNQATGLGFAEVLRSVLRQDPDVILVGEIRDEDTARTAFQAALTGHLVFSSLHTRNCFSAVSRLIDMGVESQVISEGLVSVVSQRLLRKLCPGCACKIEGDMTPSEKLFEQLTRVKPAARAKGCEACSQKGYHGRFVITEMFEMNPETAELIAQGSSSYASLRKASGKKFRSLASAAARQIISGNTTVDEVTRVLGRTFWSEIAAEYQSENPDLSSLDLVSRSADTHSILFLGDELEKLSGLLETLESSWVEVLQSSTPEDARKILEDNDQIELVVFDVSDGSSEEQALEQLAEARKALAWSRLPAVILRPASMSNLESRARDQGATSHFLAKPVSAAEILEQVEAALMSSADFRWDD